MVGLAIPSYANVSSLQQENVRFCHLCVSLSLASSMSCAVRVHFNFLFVLRTTYVYIYGGTHNQCHVRTCCVYEIMGASTAVLDRTNIRFPDVA